MFATTIVCPKGSQKDTICKGFRKDGILKNDCAICTAYKNYVKQEYPENIEK